MPADWGLDYSFPVLKNLTLSFNPNLAGTLPAAWGSDNSSMKSLNRLEINNCNVSGTLPAAWANTLPKLQQLNLSANALTGMHPQLSTSKDARTQKPFILRDGQLLRQSQM